MSDDNREKITIEKATEGLTKLSRSLQNSGVIEDQERPPTIKEKPRETNTMDKYKSLKKDIENGRVKNYYINKEGDIIQFTDSFSSPLRISCPLTRLSQ